MSSTGENKRAVIVGVFIFLAIVLFVAGVLTLGGQQKRFVSSIKVHAIFSDVEGLKSGNNVWFSGVKIGTVKSIHFHGESAVRVTLSIEEEARKYIHKDAKVRISSESLIGNRIVEIIGGSPQVAAVEEGDVLQVENGLDTEDIMATLQENNQNLVAITTDFKKLSEKLVKGEGTVGALMTDTALAANFRSIVNSLQQTTANTVQASQSLTQFTRTLNNKQGLVNDLLTDTAVFTKLESAIAQLNEASAAAAQMTTNLQQASTRVNSNESGIGVLLNDREFATQLQRTMQNLETSSEKLDQNMEALQHNFFFRGYFKDKRKAEAKAAKEAGKNK